MCWKQLLDRMDQLLLRCPYPGFTSSLGLSEQFVVPLVTSVNSFQHSSEILKGINGKPLSYLFHRHFVPIFQSCDGQLDTQPFDIFSVCASMLSFLLHVMSIQFPPRYNEPLFHG